MTETVLGESGLRQQRREKHANLIRVFNSHEQAINGQLCCQTEEQPDERQAKGWGVPKGTTATPESVTGLSHNVSSFLDT